MHIPITHYNTVYQTNHLNPHSENCTWRGVAGEFTCRVNAEYSRHCYSFADSLDNHPAGVGNFLDQGTTRVFCPIRQALSLELPDIIRSLSATPTQRISQTPKGNATVYRIEMSAPMAPEEKYWVFFRLKDAKGEPGLPVEVRLVVESAYPRVERPIFKQQMPFGQLLERSTR